MPDKKVPLRMCIACRELKDKKSLLRIVKEGNGKIFIDRTNKASGRGAYICGNSECIKKLKKTRLLNKVFSCAVDDNVYTAIEEAYIGAK